jgi:hypothetical protein
MKSVGQCECLPVDLDSVSLDVYLIAVAGRYL